ncbi:MAG: metallophosphoesterase [bacterium]|nr:metallophosphoesterase [bacterium]
MNILIPIFFLSLLVAILLGAHWFLYFSFINFFSLSGNSQKILVVFFIFLGISFILSSVLSHWNDNIFTRTYYFLSGVWLGILNNFVLSAILIWLIILIGRFFHLDLNPALLASPIFVIAFFLSIYGVWNALNPAIKNISVSIPNLPAQWQGKKIIQLSDVHLGHIYREKFIEKIVEKINSEKPEIVVITGDLFDGMDGNLAPIIKPLEDIQTKQGVFFVTGNHETYLGLENTFRMLENSQIKIMHDEVIDAKGLKIIGISYPDRNEKKDVVAILESLRKDYFGQPNILLFHSPTNISEIKNQGVNLELCGHTHVGQIFPFNLITKLIYHGYDHGLFQMENYTLYTSNGAGTWGPAMRLGNTPEIVVITLQ